MPRLSRAALLGAIVVIAAAALAATLLLGHSSQSRSEAGRFDLRLSDLRGGYREVSRVTPRDGCASPKFDAADARRLAGQGVIGCTLVKDRRLGGGGIELVYLRTYRYADASSASSGMAKLRASYVRAASGEAAAGSTHSVAVNDLGDEAPPGLRVVPALAPSSRGISYWWRRSDVVAVLVAGGTLGDLKPRSLLTLAHRIDARQAG